jgi:hypothetical protein
MRNFLPLSLLLLTCGCVERTLTVRTDPPESLLYLNGVEVGRTPYRRNFIFYGTYDVVVRKEGFETVKGKGPVIAPWWQWPPFDLVADLLPLRLHDSHLLTYTLLPTSTAAENPQNVLARGETIRQYLESSVHTRTPGTRPATKPTGAATRKAPAPSTQPDAVPAPTR